MSEPIYSGQVERFYGLLPDHYRRADAEDEWPLKRWLAGIVTEHGQIEVLTDKIGYETPDEGGKVGETSALVDAKLANASWLEWQAQVKGVNLPVRLGLSDTQTRDLLTNPAYLIGTKQSIIDSVAVFLKAPKTVKVYKPVGTDPWNLNVDVNKSELAGASYATLSLQHPTYADLNAAYAVYSDHGSSEYLIRLALMDVKPAGVKLTLNVLV